MRTVDGEAVEVKDVGRLNTDAGPDFFNAKIKIGDVLWAGNVELHLNASDWKKHHHDMDAAYENVILHVVTVADDVVKRPQSGEPIPTIVLKYPLLLEYNFDDLLKNKSWVPCASSLAQVDAFAKNIWLERLLVQRLEGKTAALQNVLSKNSNDWESTFYLQLSHYFGFKVNSQPFEQMAQSLPLSCLRHQGDNLLQMEALVFGQSGLLGIAPEEDAYVVSLRNEYVFLQNKYGLKPIDGEQWKMMRLRPGNMPYLRLAQFTSLLYLHPNFVGDLLVDTSVEGLRKFFAVKPENNYWNTHYRFGAQSSERPKQIGKLSVDVLIINVAVPFVFAYGRANGKEALCERALDLLEQLPPEQNSIVEHWKGLGMAADNAARTQSLLQLKTNYCDKRECLRCSLCRGVLKM